MLRVASAVKQIGLTGRKRDDIFKMFTGIYLSEEILGATILYVNLGLFGFFKKEMVGHEGFEPSTKGLKVPCSTN